MDADKKTEFESAFICVHPRFKKEDQQVKILAKSDLKQNP